MGLGSAMLRRVDQPRGVMFHCARLMISFFISPIKDRFCFVHILLD